MRIQLKCVAGAIPEDAHKQPSGLSVYPHCTDSVTGTVELLKEDIPALHAALDMVSWIDDGGERGDVFKGVEAAYQVVSDDKVLATVRTRPRAKEIMDLLAQRNITVSMKVITLGLDVSVSSLLEQREQAQKKWETSVALKFVSSWQTRLVNPTQYHLYLTAENTMSNTFVHLTLKTTTSLRSPGSTA